VPHIYGILCLAVISSSLRVGLYSCTVPTEASFTSSSYQPLRQSACFRDRIGVSRSTNVGNPHLGHWDQNFLDTMGKEAPSYGTRFILLYGRSNHWKGARLVVSQPQPCTSRRNHYCPLVHGFSWWITLAHFTVCGEAPFISYFEILGATNGGILEQTHSPLPGNGFTFHPVIVPSSALPNTHG
jgi:hypothetical protein